MKDNKLIAEFMGIVYTKNSYEPYHTEWNWLMPVVQKIETLGYWFNRTDGDVTIVDDNGDIVVNTPNSDGGIDIYHKAVVEFIKTREFTE